MNSMFTISSISQNLLLAFKGFFFIFNKWLDWWKQDFIKKFLLLFIINLNYYYF